MTYKKYRTDWKAAPLKVAIAICIAVVLTLTSPHVNIYDRGFDIVILILLYCVIDGFIGNYIVINDTGVYRVDFFVWKRGLTFSEIYGCYYHPTWIIGSRARSLSIVPAPNSKRKAVQLATNHFHSLETMAEVIYEIKQKNPSVQLDRPAVELMNKAVHY